MQKIKPLAALALLLSSCGMGAKPSAPPLQRHRSEPFASANVQANQAPLLELVELSVTQRLGADTAETFPERVYFSKTFAENENSPVLLYVTGEWELTPAQVERRA